MPGTRLGPRGYAQGDYTYSFGGTSSSTPLAAGLAGLMLSVRPDLSSAEIKRYMMETADKIDQQHGEYDSTGHSKWFGHGRINAERALHRIVGAPAEAPQTLYMERRVNEAIVDLRETHDEFEFPVDAEIDAIEVMIDIRHTYRGDLIVDLLPPITGAQPIRLHNKSGGGQDDLHRVYRSSSDPHLFQGVIGNSAQGPWKLKVEDVYTADQGALLRWAVGITY